jgi:hypothetical protein
MPEYDYYTLNLNATQRIDELVRHAERSRVPGRRRRRQGRHALAARLHHLAERIDG